MFITGSHPQVDESYRSYLTAKALSGQAVINVQSVADFAVNDFLCIGIPGQDLTEIKKIASFSGKAITFSANLDNTHQENCKVFVIKYDKIKFLKATSIDGSYSVVSTKDLAIGEKHTIYEDTSALTTDYFKTFHFNSQTNEASPLSDPISSAGYSRSSLVRLVDTVWDRFGDKKRAFLVREEIVDWVNEAKDILVNAIAESNEKYFNTKATIAMESDGEQALPADFKKELKVRASYDGVETSSRRAEWIEIEDLEDEDATYDQSSPMWYFNNFEIGVRPKGTSSGRIYLWYEAHPADLDTDSDTLPKPINNYTHLVIDYCLGRAYAKDKKFNVAKYHENRFDKGSEEMIEQINNLVFERNRSVRDNEDLD